MAEPSALAFDVAGDDAGPAWRGELSGWCALGLSALAIAGAFALLLALSRVPGVEHVIPWPLDFFHKGLVIHVVFSFVVWFLAVFGALALAAARALSGGRPRGRGLGPVAAAAMAVAAPLLFVPALLDRGEPTLNDYIPMIIDPLYYAGLAVMAVAVTLVAVRLVINARPGRLAARPEAAGIAAAAVIALLAVVCFAVAAVRLQGDPPSHAFNQDLVWAGGHLLQVLNTQLLLVAWAVLAGGVVAGRAVPATVMLAASALLLAAAAAGPVLMMSFEPFSARETAAFTMLQYALAPPALIVAIAIAVRRPRWRTAGDPAAAGLLASLLLFAVGGAFGFAVDGADTRTPAHYHGVIAAVTVVFMALFYVAFLPALNRAVPAGRLPTVQIWLFAGGQLAACIGLFLAGGHGAPRKTAGAAQGLETLGAWIGMGMNGLGGLIAVVGGFLFVWVAASALLRPARPAMTDVAAPMQS